MEARVQCKSLPGFENMTGHFKAVSGGTLTLPRRNVRLSFRREAKARGQLQPDRRLVFLHTLEIQPVHRRVFGAGRQHPLPGLRVVSRRHTQAGVSP